MKARMLMVGFAVAGLAGCAVTPEARVQRALTDAGLKPPVAHCMAERMVRKLSIAQLRRLQAAAKLPGQPVGHMSVHEIIRRLDALGDPEIVTVTTRAAIGCEIADG